MSWRDDIKPKATKQNRKRDGPNNQRVPGSVGDHISGLRRIMKAIDRTNTSEASYDAATAKHLADGLEAISAAINRMRKGPKGSTIMVNMTDAKVDVALSEAIGYIDGPLARR